MDYQALIDETKHKIDNFSFDDSAYTAIYNEAKLRLTNAYKASDKSINTSLGEARQRAVGENALATKSLQEALAVRGLAKSGESSMLRLNQQLSLSNALANISSEGIKSKAELYSQHQKELAELGIDIGKQKANAIEAEKGLLYDRLSELEQLKADDERWRATLYASSSSPSSSGSNKTDTESDKTAVEGNKPQLNTGNAANGFINGLGNPNGVTPNYKAEKVANDIMLNCGAEDKKIRTSNMQSRIYKELARLIISSNYSVDYSIEVLNVLRSHGFNVEFDIALARSDKMKQAYYAYQNNYRLYYSALIRSGFNSSQADARAKSKAKKYIEGFVKSMKLSENEYNKVLDMLWLLN